MENLGVVGRIGGTAILALFCVTVIPSFSLAACGDWVVLGVRDKSRG
jgi:hypothetical protein